MTEGFCRLLSEALLLSPDERGLLVSKLIDSLDPVNKEPSPEEWKSLWAEEIGRRLDSLDSGETKTIPWEEARKMIFRKNSGG